MQLSSKLLPVFVVVFISLSGVNSTPISSKEDENPTARFDKLLESSSALGIPLSFIYPYKQYTDTLNDFLPKDVLHFYPNSDQRKAYLDKAISNYEQKLLQQPQQQQMFPQEFNQQSKFDFRDLFLRAYTKTVAKKDQKPGLMERLYVLCTKIPIIGRYTCPPEEEQQIGLGSADPWTRYDKYLTRKDKPGVVFIDDSYEQPMKKSVAEEPPQTPLAPQSPQTGEKTCLSGTYLKEVDTCLLYVDQAMNFMDARNYCGELAEEGRLWLTNTDAAIADEILIANRFVEKKYTAWIDATYLTGTLIGTGIFDSNYKMWLELGQVRGKPNMRDRITLSGNEYESFYTYANGEELNTFICQSTPLELSDNDLLRLKSRNEEYNLEAKSSNYE